MELKQHKHYNPDNEPYAEDEDTLERSQKEDRFQEALDEMVAMLNSEMEVETAEPADEVPEEISEEIAEQTAEAESTHKTMDTHILRDFDEGIIIFDKKGYIRYLNPAASRIMGLKHNSLGKRYRDVFHKDNHALRDFLVKDTVEKNTSHRGDILFYREDGSVARLNMSSICLSNDESTHETSYAIHFEDITEIDSLRRKRRESSAVFIGTMAAVSIWMYVVALWQMKGEPCSQEIMTQFIHVIALVMFFCIRRYTHFTFEEMGLKIKGISKAVWTDTILTAVIATMLFAAKVILLRTSPGFFEEGAPFWDWSKLNWSDIAYPFTAVLQEFLSRGVIHENLRRIFVGKHSEGAAIVISSLLFGALHIHRGFMYMIAATVLLGLFGVLYRKQNSIWGLVIPHFVLGEIVWYLGFV